MFDVPSVLPLRRHPFRRDLRSVDVIPDRVLKPLDRELFELVFGDHPANQARFATACGMISSIFT